MNPKVMQRLIWKDARTIASLTIAIFVGVIVFNLLQFVLASTTEIRSDDQFWVAYGIWIVMPNLIALGAPAMLVGGEEESGALAWLRTLPASWQAITRSKLLVSGTALLVVFIAGTIGFQIQWNSFPEYSIDRLRATGNAPEHFALHLIGQLFFSVVLLLVSFTTAHLFRSPVSALVAVVPIMVALTLTFLSLSDYLSRHGYGQNPWWEMASTQAGLFASIALLFLAAVFIVHQWSARRRLVAPESDLKEKLGEQVARDAFRPPPLSAMSWYGVSLTLRTPSRSAALLWQSSRQMGWLVGLSLMTIVAEGVFFSAEVHAFEPVGLFASVLAFLMIGGVTFYGDAVRQRCQFLYDRGVSPTMVWATRVGPTMLAALLVTAVVLLSVAATNIVDRWIFFGMIGVVMGIYAMCQLASIWAPRPILVFFLSPVLIGLAGLGLAPLFEYYHRAVGVLIVCVPLFLFASWWMTPRWMARRTGRSFSGLFVATLALGLIIPYFLIIGGRWVAMPRERTAWRQMMMTVDLNAPRVDAEPFVVSDPDFVATVDQMRSMEIAAVVQPDDHTRKERLRLEIEETRQLGSHISLRELLSLARQPRQIAVVESDSESFAMEFEEEMTVADEEWLSIAKSERAEIDLLVAKALAKWSRVIREKALVGDATFSEVRSADYADETFADLYEHYSLTLDESAKWTDLARMLPMTELSRRARLAGLVTSWRRFQEGGREAFLGQRPTLPSQTWLAVERIRADRYIDEVAHLMFQQMQSGENFATMEKQELLDQYLVESHVLPSPGPREMKGRIRAAFARQFIRDVITEGRIAQITRPLRKMEAKKSGS